jgi:hypothetical protein
MFSFELTVSVGSRLITQRSPLRFKTEEEATAYALKTFEPPESVVRWVIIRV